jgi:uncharacterized membrane protein YeiH
MKQSENKLLFAVDMAGTLLFAMEGATAAIGGSLDLLGVMVLAFATALAGGIIRDLLIGATPPASLRDWRYSAMAFTGGGIVFFLHRYVQGIPGPAMVVLDGAALALFAVAGTEKALDFGVHPFIAILLGGMTAWAEERCATFCWRGCHWCCVLKCMRRRRWPDRRRW